MSNKQGYVSNKVFILIQVPIRSRVKEKSFVIQSLKCSMIYVSLILYIL